MSAETISFSRRRLPHWEVYDKAYFVTIRLRGTLPKETVLKLKDEKAAIEKGIPQIETEELYEFQRRVFRAIEGVLDSIHSKTDICLSDDEIAVELMNSFEFLEEKYCWRFPSYVIMPNHIHCLAIADKEGENISLTKIFSLYKRFTAKHINKVLSKKGRVWVDENFDHWCRSPEKVESVKRYIHNNPVKAGLVGDVDNWKWKK